MFEKTKSNIKSFLQHQKNDPDYPKLEASWKENGIGFFMLIIFLFLAYSVGRADGRQAEIDEIPQLQVVQSHLAEVEKACHLTFETPKAESQVVGAAK
jgi:hypothetical protein